MARFRSALFAGMTLGVVATILGARWTLIDRFGIDLPTWDEWDAQGLHALVPWYHNRALLAEMFTPHNEHVVAVTKLTNLALALLNGQWDQRLEAVVNAFLPATIAFAFLIWVRNFLRPVFVAALSLVLLAAWALPFAWHNTISGFHSQQFFVIAFSFAAIGWLPFTATGSWRWWLGAIASVLALVSMASGFLAAILVLILAVVRVARKEAHFRDCLPALLIVTAVSVTGMLMQHEVPYHQTLKASTATDFIGTCVHAFQWPATQTPWLAIVLWLPWLVLASVVLFSHHSDLRSDRNAWRLLGLGAWVGLNIAATAYGRGAGAPMPSTRYLDTLVFGCVVNAIALGWLTQKFIFEGKRVVSQRLANSRTAFGVRFGLFVFALVWLTTFGTGISRDSQRALREDLPALHDYQRQALARTRAYLETRNPAYLESKDIPYPGADSFIYRLNLPELSGFLPATVAAARRLSADSNNQGFTRTSDIRALPWAESTDTGMILGLNKPSHTPKPPFHRAYWTTTKTGGEPRGEWFLEKSPSGWLVFAVQNSSQTTLELHDRQSDKTLGEIHSSRPNEWMWVSVRAPASGSVLRGHFADPDPFLAFTEPVFMPTLSYVAWRVSANGRFVQEFGLITLSLCTLLFGIAEACSQRTRVQVTSLAAS